MARPTRPLSAVERGAAALVLLAMPWVAFSERVWRSCFMDGGDDVLHNLPLLTHSARAVLTGSLFWSPSTWMGTPLLEEPEAAVLYPPKLLFAWVASPVVAYALYVYLHYVLAHVAAFAYARTLALSFGPSLFAGVAYGLSAFVVAHQGHTLFVVAAAWAPLFLVACQRHADGGSARWLLAAIGAFAMPALAGAFQPVLYLAGMALLLHGALAWQARDPVVLTRAASAVALGFLAAAAQILPSALYSASLDARGRADFAFSTEHSLSPAMLATMVMRPTTLSAEGYVFVGMSVATAALVGLWALWREPSSTDAAPGAPRGSSSLATTQRAWALVAAVAGLLMLGRNLPLITRALHALPLVGLFRAPMRHSFELSLALSVLAAIGLERGVPREALPRLAARGLAAAIVLFGIHRFSRALGEVELADVLGLDAAAVSVAALALALVCLGRRWWWGLALLAVAELVWVQERVAPSRPDAAAELEDARALVASARTRSASPRFLTPDLYEGRLATLSGNTTMLFAGVGHLDGYASMSPQEATHVLGLDEFGVAWDLDGIAMSALPEVFGVTDLIGPTLVLGTPTITLDADTCGDGAPRALELIEGHPIHCRRVLSEGRRVLFVEGAEGQPIRLLQRSTRRGPYADDRTVTADAARPLELLENTRIVRVEASSPASIPREAALVERELVPLLEGPTAVVVRNEGGPAAASSSPLLWPPDARPPFVMEAEASGTYEGAVVVDLYGDGYDPHDAQVVLPEAGRGSSIFDAPPPPGASWRAFLEGRGEARVEQSRILAAERETRRFPLTAAGVSYFGAVRPLEIVTRLVNRDRAHEARVSILLRENERSFRIETLSPGETRDVRWTIPIAATAPALTLDASVEGGPVSASVLVREAPRARRRVLVEAGPSTSHYAIPDAVARVYTPTRVRLARTLDEVREALSREDLVPGQDVTVDRELVSADSLRPATVRPRFEAERVEIEVEAPEGPALVVLNDRLDPRWRAWVDGEETRIVRINGLVRGVEVPRGRHAVVFAFPVPWSFWLGLACLAGSLGLALSSGRWRPRLDAWARALRDRRRAAGPTSSTDEPARSADV